MRKNTAALGLLAAGLLQACSSVRTGDAEPIPNTGLAVVPRPRVLIQRSGAFSWNHGAVPRSSLDPALRARYGPEAYTLDVGASGIQIRGASEAGIFYARQTLDQIAAGGATSGSVPYVHIVDWPTYRWRGVQLDVSRHYFTVATIERLIDTIAQVKLNVFAWHLTDDQAWRLQSRAFPRLAAPLGYSVQDVAAVVSYARQRHVTVVPEIEVPGHRDAALRAYPGAATSVAFWKTALREVAQHFPSPYLHVGGDEVAYTSERRAFLRAITRSVSGMRRVPVAWDDALAADLTQPAVYVVWRRYSGMQPALRSGHDLVLSPDGPLYFDAYQGDRNQEPPASPHMSTLEEVYDYDPPSGPHILGVQANLWTEKIGTQDHLWYMLFPRTLALAELAWDPPARKSWPDFLRRLPAQLARLQSEGVTFRIPAVAFAVEGARFFAVPGNATAAIARTRRGDATVALRVPVSGGRIYYTTDGSAPSQRSIAYSGPFRIRVAPGGTTVRAYAVTSDGRSGTVSRCSIVSDPALAANAGSRAWSSLVSP